MEDTMYLANMFDPDFVVPLLIFSLPIIAIVGGITAGILKQAGRQRLIELAQQERIAAIQRGIDPSQLPPLPVEAMGDAGVSLSVYQSDKRRAQAFLIAGVITLFAGIGLMAFLLIINDDNDRVWSVGLIPAVVGISLLISARLIWPRTEHNAPRA
jgi:hypothetical protein